MEGALDINVFFDNLSFLISEKGMKVGEFEKRAGVNQGYISRKAAKDSTKIKLDFVARAADILGVSIDRLLRVKISELTKEEVYCLNFIDKLLSDTANDELEWFSYFFDPDSPGEPTLCVYTPGQWQYIGTYKDGKTLIPSGAFLHAAITKEAEVHLSCVKAQGYAEPDYEGWIIPIKNGEYDYGNKEKFASSIKTKGGRSQRVMIGNKLKELYSSAKNSLGTSMKLSSTTRSIIDEYMFPF